jgi:phage-related protein (TIGR01555 family)
MTKPRNVKSASAALAPPASAGDRLPSKAPKTTKMSMADALENPVSGLGTERDKRFWSDYGFVSRLTAPSLRSMFRKSWLANAIITVPNEDMTREWVTVKWDGIKPEETAAIKRAERRLRLKAKTKTGLNWGGLFGGGAIVIIIAGQDPAEPLDMNRIPKNSLRQLVVKDREWIFPLAGAPDRDIENSDNFGMPSYYSVRGSSARFHHSRVVRFEGQEVTDDDFLTNGYWHDSQLQHVLTSVKDYDGGKENVASMLWEAKLDVIKTGLAKLLALHDGGAAVERRYRDAVLGKSNHRLLLINEDEEYEQKNIPFGGVHDVLGDFVVDVCGAARIPMVKLFGQSAPGMNSTGDTDLRLYYDRVAAEAERVMLPPLNYLYEIILRSELGRMPDGFEVCPNPLWQVSDKERAEIEYQRAQADAIYLKEGMRFATVLRRLKANGTYDLTDEEIAAAEEIDLALPEETPTNEPDPAAPTKGKPPANAAA